MRITLVGADHEENLGVGSIAAAAEQAGHEVRITPYNQGALLERTTARVLDATPDAVGLSIQFQHRAHDFLALARRLRARGFAGHITAGGQYPTLAADTLLSRHPELDSVVLHDGELTSVELWAALEQGRPLEVIPGLAYRDAAGMPARSAPRRLVDDLDALPFPRRYRPHSSHVGVPFIPIMGSRGCWGRCTFCSISACYRDARARGGGKLLRHRSPDNIAAEMALLWHSAGGKGIFCFHDDNFLLPRPADSLARLRALRAALDRFGVGRVGLVGKCRPECLTAELALALRELGVIRLYVGVENVSAAGSAHLCRSRQTARVREALAACDEAGIFACYNLLIFEPQTTLDDVADNLAFIREQAHHPVNFCRTEPYSGTPLATALSAAGNLEGSHLGYDYRIADDRAELLFRICAAAFRQRNFASGGVHNRYMGLGYCQKIIEQFYDDEVTAARLDAEVVAHTRAITLQSAGFLAEALELARTADLDDRDAIERETALLALRIAEADAVQLQRLDALYGKLEAFGRRGAPAADPRAPLPPSSLRSLARQVAQGVTIASLVAALSGGVQGCDEDRPAPTDAGVDDGRADVTVVDMLPPDGMVVDPLPPDGMIADPPPADGMIVDPLPADGGMDMPIPDPPPPDGMIVDPPPPDSGMDIPIPDPLPPDGMMGDPLPADTGVSSVGSPDAAGERLAIAGQPPEPELAAQTSSSAAPSADSLTLGGQFRDTAPARALRSQDLPLFDPPTVCLSAQRGEDGVIRVALRGGPASPSAVSFRWEGDGHLDGDGREVRWSPESPDDQLRVGIRTVGGVAVTAIRAKDVVG